MNDRMNYDNERINEWKIEQINERMNEWMNGRMNDRMNYE